MEWSRIKVMPLRVAPIHREALARRILTELAIQKERSSGDQIRFDVDFCDWQQKNFYIPITEKPVVLMPHQIATLRYIFSRREDHKFPAQTIVYSTIKQSGKSTAGGMAMRYMAETQTRMGEVFAVGNDLDQAKTRGFREARYSIELTPGYNHQSDLLPGLWRLQKLSMENLLTGSTIRALAVDAKGEAGGKPALSVWTELWGFEHTDGLRFWDEMTPVPTVPDSIRMVETYAGYDGESKLLRGLYDKGREGHQLTAGELAAFSCREDVPGETFEDLVNGWAEAHGNPDFPVPVWFNEQAGVLMYWDEGENARRMPWQRGEEGDRYYREQEASLPGPAYRRMHRNEWVGAESQFIELPLWDACGHVHDVSPLTPGDMVPTVVGVDAATTGDCFGIVAVCRCPIDPTSVDIKGIMKYDPAELGGAVSYDEPEAWLRAVADPKLKLYNVAQIAYDPYQLEAMMQRLRRDSIAWCEPFNQMGDRLKADRGLFDMVKQRRVHFSPGAYPALREHISNANVKIQKDEDSKMRIVKKPSGRKIDLAVALSMAAARCMYLMLG